VRKKHAGKRRTRNRKFDCARRSSVFLLLVCDGHVCGFGVFERRRMPGPNGTIDSEFIRTRTARRSREDLFISLFSFLIALRKKRIKLASGVMKFNFRADHQGRIAPRFPPHARSLRCLEIGNLAIARKRDRNNYSARNALVICERGALESNRRRANRQNARNMRVGKTCITLLYACCAAMTHFPKCAQRDSKAGGEGS